MRVPQRFKMCCHLLVVTVTASLLAIPPASPAAAAPPVAPAGAGPVDRGLPASATPNHGLPAGQVAPPVPPAVESAGKPSKVAASARADRRAATARALRADAQLAAPGTPIVRPGFLLGDTSLVVYFDAEVADGDPTSWARWWATVRDVESGAEQRSADKSKVDLSRCSFPAKYCHSFGAADGWVLDPARTYTVTITVAAPEGELSSAESKPAQPRKVDNPPSVPASQAVGCGCATVLGTTARAQAFRAQMVNTGTGTFQRVEQDFAMPSYGIPFRLARYYSSGNTSAGMFGVGWSSSYDIRIVAADNGAARVRAEDGAEAVYTGGADGTYEAPAGVRAKLTKVADGWQLVPPDRRVLRFGSDGRLISIQNARGHGVTLAYTAQGVIDKITDASGRIVDFEARADLRLVTKVTMPDGRSVQFDYEGTRLLKVQDARRYTTSYGYDAAGRLATVTDARGARQLFNEYDAAGRVGRQTDAENAVTEFLWDAGEQFATTKDPDGVVVIDGYRDNVLVWSRNSNNDVVNTRYDGKLQKNLVVDPKGNQEQTSFDPAGNPRSRTAPEPFSFTQTSDFDDRGNLTKFTDGREQDWIYTYNQFNELTSQRNPEQKSGYRYEYDAYGQVVKRTDPRDKATSYEYDSDGNRVSETSPTGRKTLMVYDRTGRMTSVVDPRGTVAGANPDQYRTRFTYDEENQVVEVRQPGKNAPSKKTFDELGNLVVVTDPLSGNSHYTYDKAGRPVLAKDPIGNTTATAYTPAGRRKSITVNPGELNLTTTWTYDNTGRVATEVVPLGNANPAQAELYTSRFVYDFNGNLVQADRPYGSAGVRVKVDTDFDALDRPDAQVDQLGRSTSVRYDNAGNVVGMKNENGEELTSSFDGANRRTGSSTASGGANAGIEYDEVGNPVEQTTPTGGVITWKYDDDGRPIEITDPRGNVAGNDPGDYTTKYSYDRAGNPETMTDPLGNVSRQTYDANDRLVASTDANNHTTRYGYNDNDWLTSVVGPDSNGAALTYQYNASGQVIRRTDPLSRSSTTEYDKAGRTVASTDALGRRREYVYDANSQLIEEITARMVEPNRPDPNIPAKTIYYGYDNLGRMIRKQLGNAGPVQTYGYDAKNKLTAAADPSGVQSREYDTTDRLTKVIRGDEVFGYDYDDDDRIIGRSYPDGTKIAAEYDDGDRITALTSSKGGNSARYGFGYDVSDNLVKTTYPASSGVVEERGYDRAGRMTRIAATDGDTVLSAFDLALDKVGNPTRITETKGEPGQPTSTEATAYTYDAADRLTAECFGALTCAGASAERTDYTYDLVGNRATKKVVAPGENTTTNYAYDAADQLTQERITGTRTNERTFEYDLEGNQIRAGNDRYTYALDHTMTSATVGGKTTEYTWDALGNRIKAVTGAAAEQVVQTWAWDMNAGRPLLASETQTGAAARSYLYDPAGQPLALLAPSGGGQAAHSYLHDWLGGVAGMVAPDGTPEWSYDYDAFGVTRGTGLTDGGKKLDGDAPANPLQYAGTYRDVSQGDRYAMGARNYDPGTGRFDANDPAAQPATDPAVSSYSYTNARPTVLTDPTGLDPDIGSGMTATYVDYYTSQYELNHPDAATTNADANVPAGGTVEVDNPEWLSAKKLVDEAEGFVKQIGDEIVNLILDLVGFNDAKKCITEGDIVACVSTALQAVPWGKMFKAAKVAIKAVGVGRRLIEAYGNLKSARNALTAIPQRIKKAVEAPLSTVKSSAARQVENTVKAAKDIGGKAKATAKKAATNVRNAIKTTTQESCKVAKGASKRLSNSFVAGTAVLMADGSTKPIEKLKPGDTVKATDAETGLTEPQQVTATITGSGDKALIELTLVGAGAGGGGPPAEVTATAGHKFYSPEKGWTTAGELKAGDTLRDTRGNTVTVARTAGYSSSTTVYNLTISGVHTYYVVSGETSVLVHNCGAGTPCTCNTGDVVPYRPTHAGLENHHGVLDVWAKHNVPGYKSRAAGSTTVALTKAEHDATKSVYRDWLEARTGKRVGGKVDWTTVGPREAYDLSERMFDAAGTSQSARDAYYSEFTSYIYGLG